MDRKPERTRQKPNLGLTKREEREKRFVSEYLIDLNATAAAIRAGWSAKTAKQTAHRALHKPTVAAAIAEALEARAKRTGIDADWLLSRLADEAEADVADLYGESGVIKPVTDWPVIWRKGLVAGIDVESIGDGAGRVTKLRISDRNKRLELIGKHVDVQAFRERHEHSGPGGGPISMVTRIELVDGVAGDDNPG